MTEMEKTHPEKKFYKHTTLDMLFSETLKDNEAMVGLK